MHTVSTVEAGERVLPGQEKARWTPCVVQAMQNLGVAVLEIHEAGLRQAAVLDQSGPGTRAASREEVRDHVRRLRQPASSTTRALCDLREARAAEQNARCRPRSRSRNATGARTSVHVVQSHAWPCRRFAGHADRCSTIPPIVPQVAAEFIRASLEAIAQEMR